MPHFHHFHRIMQSIQKTNGDRHLFWLYECSSVVSSPVRAAISKLVQVQRSSVSCHLHWDTWTNTIDVLIDNLSPAFPHMAVSSRHSALTGTALSNACDSRFFQREAALWDTVHFSSHSRRRLFWGNLPDMYRPPQVSPQRDPPVDLSNFIAPSRIASVRVTPSSKWRVSMFDVEVTPKTRTLQSMKNQKGGMKAERHTQRLALDNEHKRCSMRVFV